MARQRAGAAPSWCRWIAAGTVTVALLAAPACSDDDDEDDATGVTTTTTTATEASSATSSTADALRPTPTSDADLEDTAAPVGLDEVAEFGDGVTARVVAIEAVDAESRLPGERSGPALAITIELTNTRDTPAELNAVTVDLRTGDDLPATFITQPDQPGFSGMLAPGQSARARFTFLVDPARRDAVAIRVTYSSDTPIVVFAGDARDA